MKRKQSNDLASMILEALGGSANIFSLSHCMTRLRLDVKNMDFVNVNQLKALDGVINVVLQQTKIQIVIGPKVQQVYDQLELLREQSAPSMVTPSHQRKTSLISRILDTISRIFTPVIGAIAGAGMIKALLALLVAANLIDKTGQNYYVLNFIGDAAFYFMPILLAMSAAKQFKCNAYLAVVLAGILLHPHLVELKSAGEAVTFLGIPMVLASYSASVVPMILITWVMSFVEKTVRRYTPKSIEIFFVPMVVLLVMAPLALLAIGPLGTMAGNLLASLFKILDQKVGWILPIMMGMICPLLVMTGMHYSLLPIQLAQYATLGYATLMGCLLYTSDAADE